MSNLATVKPEILSDDSVVWNVFRAGEQIAHPLSESAARRMADAINARIHGEYDHPALLELGALHSDEELDIKRIIAGEKHPATPATARLIAAAPELLSALESLEMHLAYAFNATPEALPLVSFGRANIQKFVTEARAAIAKAKGETV